MGGVDNGAIAGDEGQPIILLDDPVDPGNVLSLEPHHGVSPALGSQKAAESGDESGFTQELAVEVQAEALIDIRGIEGDLVASDEDVRQIAAQLSGSLPPFEEVLDEFAVGGELIELLRLLD